MLKMSWLSTAGCLGVIIITTGFFEAPVLCQTGGDYTSLKIAPPPNGGIYLGQYEWVVGQVDTFEMAIGRETAWFGRYGVMDVTDNGFPEFNPEAAEIVWQSGQVTIVNAIEAYPNPDDNAVAGFTVDKLLNGDYETELKALAEQFRQFGKPMFFLTAREPMGIGSNYMGGFGPEGDKSTAWAIENAKGLDQFDPSGFPNAELYTDLGNDTISDGVERLVAAQRYYYDFFVNREGLEFLTFETMGWVVSGVEENEGRIVEYIEDFPGADSVHIKKLVETSWDFANYYPGDDYVDWVSINFYTLDWYAKDWPGLEDDYLVPSKKYLDDLDYTMENIRQVAPGKPVFFLEFGLPDGKKKNSAHAASRVDSVMNHIISNYPEINGISMWSLHPSWMNDPAGFGYFPFDCLIRPNTLQAAAFRNIIDANPGYFHSAVYLSDGNLITAIASPAVKSPEQFILQQNYPNPFNPETSIAYQMSGISKVQLNIYNLLGQKVRTLVKSNQTAGRYLVSWDGRNDSGERVSSGVYFYVLRFGERVTSVRKMLLLQ